MAKKKSKPKKWESMTPEQRFSHFAAKYEAHALKATHRFSQAMEAFREIDPGAMRMPQRLRPMTAAECGPCKSGECNC